MKYICVKTHMSVSISYFISPRNLSSISQVQFFECFLVYSEKNSLNCLFWLLQAASLPTIIARYL